MTLSTSVCWKAPCRSSHHQRNADRRRPHGRTDDHSVTSTAITHAVSNPLNARSSYIALSTCVLPHPSDRLNAVTLLASNIAIRIFDREAWAEFVAMGHMVFARPHLEWTLLRVGALVGSAASDKPARGNVGFPGDGTTRMWIRREQVAWRAVEALEKGAWIREMPYISA
jgi:hypothetical protein